jgi:hypothetical protein
MCGWAFSFEAGAGGSTLDHPGEAGVVNGDPRSLTKTNGDVSLSRWSRRSARSSSPHRGGAQGAVLDPPHMQHRRIEFHLIPSEVAELGRPKPVPEGQEDHGCVPLPVSIGLCGLDQRFDLPGRQVLPGSKFGVRTLRRRNCSI